MIHPQIRTRMTAIIQAIFAGILGSMSREPMAIATERMGISATGRLQCLLCQGILG